MINVLVNLIGEFPFERLSKFSRFTFFSFFLFQLTALSVKSVISNVASKRNSRVCPCFRIFLRILVVEVFILAADAEASVKKFTDLFEWAQTWSRVPNFTICCKYQRRAINSKQMNVFVDELF